MRTLRQIACIVLLVLVAGSIVGCDGRQSVDWVYVIPDNYEGFLAIRYECPGGDRLPNQNGTIEVRFHDDGTFCTAEPSFPWVGQASAYTRSGQAIPVVGAPWEHQGYGLCCAETRVLGGQDAPKYTFDLFWVGDLVYKDMITRSNTIPPTPTYNPSAFIQDRFGIEQKLDLPVRK